MAEVTVYTTTQCPYCAMVKEFLSENDIPFNEVNVEKDPGMMNRLVETTGEMGVPQTEIDGKWVIGFDPKSMMKVLKN